MAVLVDDGFDDEQVHGSMDALTERGAQGEVASKLLGDGVGLLEAVELPDVEVANGGGGIVSEQGVVTSRDAEDVDAFVDAFAGAIAEHRHWDRSEESVPA